MPLRFHFADFFRDDGGYGAAVAGMLDFLHICDSTLGAAEVYALTDPSRAPQPATALLLVVGLGIAGVTMARRA